MNKTIKLLGSMLVIMFLSVYFSRYNNSYYENKNVLTEEAIVQFEKDVKEGKNVNVSTYLKEEKDYSNKASSIAMKTSNFIELGFKKTLKLLFKTLGGLVE